MPADSRHNTEIRAFARMGLIEASAPAGGIMASGERFFISGKVYWIPSGNPGSKSAS
jgi:hypothetical protein